MLDDGLVHILATDSHDMERRPPCLGRARDRAIKRVGEREAKNLVSLRPMGILENVAASELNAIERPATGRNAGSDASGDPAPRRSFAQRVLGIFG